MKHVELPQRLFFDAAEALHVCGSVESAGTNLGDHGRPRDGHAAANHVQFCNTHNGYLDKRNGCIAGGGTGGFDQRAEPASVSNPDPDGHVSVARNQPGDLHNDGVDGCSECLAGRATDGRDQRAEPASFRERRAGEGAFANRGQLGNIRGTGARNDGFVEESKGGLEGQGEPAINFE